MVVPSSLLEMLLLLLLFLTFTISIPLYGYVWPSYYVMVDLIAMLLRQF